MPTDTPLLNMIHATPSGVILVEAYDRVAMNMAVADSAGTAQKQTTAEPLRVVGKETPPAIQEIRELIGQLRFTPHARRIVVLHNVDQMQAPAANALLKTLEEPPAQTLFLLTALPYAVLPTIRSRCMVMKFSGDATARPSVSGTSQSLSELFRSLNDKDSRALRSVLLEFLSMAASELHAVPRVSKARVSQEALALLSKNNLSKIEIQNIFLRWTHA